MTRPPSTLFSGCRSEPASRPKECARLTKTEVRAYAQSKLQAEAQGQDGILELRRINKDENDGGRPVCLLVFSYQTTEQQLVLADSELADVELP